mgnify:CR=1 FL=1
MDDSNNLFPRRPHLTLWYAPYARQQPRFDEHGVYTVDLASLRGTKVAVVTMNLSALKLQAGDHYQLSFEGKAEEATGLVVKLPESDTGDDGGPSNGNFVSLGGNYRRLQFAFKYDPETNGGAISFVFPESTIGDGKSISFRSFSI